MDILNRVGKGLMKLKGVYKFMKGLQGLGTLGREGEERGMGTWLFAPPSPPGDCGFPTGGMWRSP